LGLIDRMVQRGKEPRQPRRDIERAFLGPFEDVVIRLAVALDLGRQAAETLQAASGAREQQVADCTRSGRCRRRKNAG
jgi:hypothetical protein